MPKDIRSYFTKSPASQKPANDIKPTKIRKKPVISDDDDDEVAFIKEKPASKNPPNRQGKHVLSDSDEDVPTKKQNNSKKLTPKKKEAEKEIKAVSVAEMLGKTPIKRVNAPKISVEKDKKEADFHDDDDFEATLNGIDPAEIEAKYFKEGGSQGSGKRKKNQSSDDDVTPKKAKLDGEVKEDKGKDRERKQKSPEKEEKEKKQKLLEKEEKEKQKLLEKEEKEKKQKLLEKEEKEKKQKLLEKEEKEKESNGPHAGNSKLNLNNLKKYKSKNLEIDATEKKAPAKKSDDDGDFLEERALKKKQSTALYQQYLSRGGARDPGSKPIPEGAPNCLAGLSFVLTGVYVSLEREEAAELIQKYGGRVTQGVSKKIDYVVVGEEAGQSKINKANDLKLKQISEDDLLDLIRSRPAGNSKNIILNKTRKKEPSPHKSPERTISPQKSPKKEEIKGILQKEVKRTSPKPSSSSAESGPGHAEALVEKYRPRMMKQIIGQHGDKSNAKKLHFWLSNWYKNRKTKTTKPSPWAKSDDGAFFKACLLSGPPGVGKTTTAQVVCNELGFDLLEFNASDTRSKRLLKEEVSGLLSNTTMKGYFSDSREKPTSKHVLLMDEVDGMAGNEDRGGLQELISLIKSTDIPIICICNDRNNPKMRTLANYVFDLKFQKPRIEQIRGAMKSLCCKETIKISNEDLDRLIESTNQDIRQVINHLAMLIGDPVDNKQEQSSKLNKDLKLGPWDVVRKVFSAEEHKHMTIHDKSDLFFHDYNIAGLFVQENYLSVNPKVPRSEVLDRVAASADSLSLGDQVEKAIRSNNAWSLLPMQACYASVIPGTLMSGNITGQIQFPAWLGKNSRRGKFDRLLQEITVHTRLVTGASKEAINIDYLKPLRDAVTRPLVVDGSEGVDTAINVMNHYHLLREDLDALVEVSLWPGDRDPMQAVETKVKSAFTRNYNKNCAPAPFVVNTTISKKKGGGGGGAQDEGFIDDEENEEDEEEEEEEDESVDADKMVKAKKTSTTKATASTSKTQAKPASKRGRGRGK